jgi:hypothetical protein
MHDKIAALLLVTHLFVTKQVDLSSNAACLCLVGVQFETQPGHRMSQHVFFMVLPSPPDKCHDITVK